MPGARRHRRVVIVVSDSDLETSESGDDEAWFDQPAQGAAVEARDRRRQVIAANATAGLLPRVVAGNSEIGHNPPLGRNLATPSIAPARRRQNRVASDPPPSAREAVVIHDQNTGEDRFNGIARPFARPVVVEDATTQSQELTIDVSQADTVLPFVIDVIPDICLDHALKLIREQLILESMTPGTAAARVIEIIYENWPYPTTDKTKGKRKRESDDTDDGSGSANIESKRHNDGTLGLVDGVINYRSLTSGSEERKGGEYLKRAMRTLENTFPLITIKQIRSTYNSCNNLYAPAHFELARQAALPVEKRDHKVQERPRNRKPEVQKKKKVKGKGKGKAGPQLKAHAGVGDCSGEENKVMVEDDEGERIFLEERAWLLSWLSSQEDPQALEYLKLIDPPEGEGDVECQCCFSEEHVQFMVQCEEGHLFCRECVQRLIENAIGEHKIVHCMDGSGCTAIFPARELRKAVVRRTLEVYHNILQRKDLEEAGIQGLESCPACEYAVVIENEHEKLFRCEREDCGLVSCRSCRKPDHIPKSCKEAQKDRKLDSRHTIEEAMTDAFVRICPNSACGQSFLKELGCNKITCTKCHKISCYVCRKLITDGYAHFNQTPTAYAKGKDASKCRLWDPHTEDVYAEEVARAREAAQKQARAEAAELGEAIDEPDIDVALPVARVVHGRAIAPGADAPAGLGGPPAFRGAPQVLLARLALPNRQELPDFMQPYLAGAGDPAFQPLAWPRPIANLPRRLQQEAHRRPGGANEAALNALMEGEEEHRRVFFEIAGGRRLDPAALEAIRRHHAAVAAAYAPPAPLAPGIHRPGPQDVAARLPGFPFPAFPPPRRNLRRLPPPPALLNVEGEDDDVFA